MEPRDSLQSARIELDDDAYALYELSMHAGWGDGLPLLPATEARVLELIDAVPHPPDHLVAVLPPRRGLATIEKIAVNAAMAGVEPAAFAYVVAALEALTEPDHNLFGLVTTTSSATSALVVSGPRRRELGFDYEAGCLGGGQGGIDDRRPRGQLCLRNIGGQRAGTTSKTVFGNPARVSACASPNGRSVRPGLHSQCSVASRLTTRSDGSRRQRHADVRRRQHPRCTRPRPLIAKTLAYPLGNAFMDHPAAARRCYWSTRCGRSASIVFPDSMTCKPSSICTRGSRSKPGPPPRGRRSTRRVASSRAVAS